GGRILSNGRPAQIEPRTVRQWPVIAVSFGCQDPDVPFWVPVVPHCSILLRAAFRSPGRCTPTRIEIDATACRHASAVQEVPCISGCLSFTREEFYLGRHFAQQHNNREPSRFCIRW